MKKTSELRDRAAKILRNAFPDWDVTAGDISPVSGFWKRVDVYRWQATFYLKSRYSNGDRIPFSIGCWDRLTRFVKVASKYGFSFTDGEVSPKYPAERQTA